MRSKLLTLALVIILLFTGCTSATQEPNFSQNDLIYFIMTDRFNDGDNGNDNFTDVNSDDPKAYHGGDLKGIIDKLDYIKSLGATTIWVTPIVKNQPTGYHGYWAYDFYSVDPHLGTMDNFKKLVDEAHNKDIKVILDYVVNHTGYDSPWLKDEEKKDWFHPNREITDWANQEIVENGWLAGLPDLDQSNPKVKDFLIKNALWWIDETGIDGMRLDTVRHVPKEFWKEFATEIKKEYPDFYFLGEVWSDNTRYLELYHQSGIDGLTNYSLYEGIRNAFTRFGSTATLVNAIKKEKYFSTPELNGVFLDNHDNRRLISDGGENGKEYLKQALTFVMTYPSIPIIYYGTEIGMEGKSDPDNRRDMEWDKVGNSEIYDFYMKLVDLRNNSPALKSKEFKLLDYDKYFISYLRKDNDSSILVVMNTLNKDKSITINLPNESSKYRDILSDNLYTVVDNQIKIELEPLDILILQSY
ncbi:MAG: alpha-amlyase [Firmicutes bacterium]|nr:alpha-amlyase [Bacillota bacterium]